LLAVTCTFTLLHLQIRHVTFTNKTLALQVTSYDLVVNANRPIDQ